jgi:hypothetical protein
MENDNFELDENDKNSDFFLKCEEENLDIKKNNLSLSQNYSSLLSNNFKSSNNNNNFKLSPKFRNSFKLNYNNNYKRKKEKNNTINNRKSFIAKEKFWRNLDYDNKFIKLIEKPQSPHNTGQYICHVHNQGKKKEKNDLDNENIIGIDEGICLKGSMLNDKDITNEMDIDLDFEDINLSLNKRKRVMSVEINYDDELEKHKDYLLGKKQNETNDEN